MDTINPATIENANEMFARLGELETLLLGRNFGDRDTEPILKISTGYHPGFDVWAFAHPGDGDALREINDAILSRHQLIKGGAQ